MLLRIQYYSWHHRIVGLSKKTVKLSRKSVRILSKAVIQSDSSEIPQKASDQAIDDYPWRSQQVKEVFRNLFFKSFLTDTRVLFWGHWYPCFGFLVTSPLGFKAKVGCVIHFAEVNIMYIP